MTQWLVSRFNKRNILEIIAITLLIVGVLAALFGQYIVPFNTAFLNLRGRLLPPGTEVPAGMHLLGTDGLGRDILSLIVLGSRTAFMVSVISVSIAAAFGTVIGTWAGLVGGRFASSLILFSNVQLSFPFFLVAVAIIGMMQPSSALVIGVIAVGLWVPFARISYNSSRELVHLEFIDAVKVMRGSQARIILRHLIPNVLPNVIIVATFALANAIIAEAALSFLGLGMPSVSPTWGRMLSEGRDYASTAWWLTVFPGLAVFLLVLSINIIGERLRIILDPRTN
ncbi:ABC transporter permease [Microvirga sp. 2YAF29]|uniref:ABC transporter permease n=1 Tax=Microvirga sp. 2YAF29 TaxID=3233031 RepID=UPI003F9AB82F